MVSKEKGDIHSPFSFLGGIYNSSEERVTARSADNSHTEHRSAMQGKPRFPYGVFKMVGREGFEPSKAMPTDLQSVAFDRFATCP